MPARLVLATHNQGKLRELRALLRGHLPHIDVDSDIVDAGSLGIPDVVETGVTFAQNSLLKAEAVHAFTGLPAVADDSGLSVLVLGGAPGIFSARWSGRHGDDAANLRLLLAQLNDIADEHRQAEFVCAASLVTSDARAVEQGTLPGTLLRSPRGENGFGYDPILQPEGMTRSCAELSAEEKNAISHRSKALASLLPAIIDTLAEGYKPSIG